MGQDRFDELVCEYALSLHVVDSGALDPDRATLAYAEATLAARVALLEHLLDAGWRAPDNVLDRIDVDRTLLGLPSREGRRPSGDSS